MQATLQLQNSATAATAPADAIALQSEDESTKRLLKREDERQKLFHKISNKYFEVPNGYLQVEVLVVRWEKDLDEFKEHDTEIERLRHIFEDGFGYRCHVKSITNRVHPQNQLNTYISSHVQEYDGRNNLLIVYYTGHGSQVPDTNGEKRLLLSAHRHWDNTKSGHPPEAFWDVAETPLKEYATSDVLTILDCCFASTAADKSMDHDSRIYQLLAASPAEGRTKGPGERSFTNALCQSLEQLLRETPEGTFSLLKLSETINSKRGAQAALIWDRLHRYHGHVELGRLAPAAERQEAIRKEEHEQSALTLRLSLTTKDLRNDQIEKLAQHFHKACKNARMPIRRVKWVRLEHGAVFRAANEFKRAGARRKSTSSKFQGADDEPESRKRTRLSTSSLPIPKRPTIQSLDLQDGLETSSRYLTPLSSGRSGSPGSD